jgi:hypothetical protein
VQCLPPRRRPRRGSAVTDFTASNIGTVANPRLPYYAEQQPDARGFAANLAGASYVDPGVAGFLAEHNLLSHPLVVDQRWRPLEAEHRPLPGTHVTQRRQAARCQIRQGIRP